MTGDRKLTLEELALFLQHDTNFARNAMESGGEPSLHDVVLIEILGKHDALKELIIDQGSKIRNLQYELDGLRQQLTDLREEKTK